MKLRDEVLVGLMITVVGFAGAVTYKLIKDTASVQDCTMTITDNRTGHREQILVKNVRGECTFTRLKPKKETI